MRSDEELNKIYNASNILASIISYVNDFEAHDEEEDEMLDDCHRYLSRAYDKLEMFIYHISEVPK